MEQYISKDALVREIEERIKKYATINVGNSSELDALYGAKCKALTEILHFLNTLKEKEVDLEKEITSYIQDNTYNGYLRTDIHDAAEHFFELGLKAKGK